MKKHALLSIALVATCLSCFANEAHCPDVKVIQLTSLTDHDLKEIMEGQHPELAVEFSAHTHLPISFYLKGDLVQLAENDEKWGTIEIKQTFYVRCVGETFILSSNLTDWKPFLDFITGNASVALGIQDGQPSLVVGSETNRRP